MTFRGTDPVAEQIGGGIHLDTTQMEAVAAFLWVINTSKRTGGTRAHRGAHRNRSVHPTGDDLYGNP